MPSAWSRAAELAAQTPASRNRYVDFLRALSILCVIAGHWTAAAPHVDAAGRLTPSHILAAADWTHWLTWVIQVMPVFFMVGGFSNGITWRAAQRDGLPYREWLAGRLKRLIWPVLPLLVAWAVLGVLATWGGVPEAMIRVGSQMALIPIWFLAVYVGVVVLVPLSHYLWERFGWLSFWAFVLEAIVIDYAFFHGFPPLGWLNYLFVWSAVHQLGYAWGDGALDDWRRMLVLCAVGLGLLLWLTGPGPYPRAMVGVPGDAISNTTPPKITLIALACAQGGLLLSLQSPGRRWLARASAWTATVLINGMIMTIYLWHLTAMVLVIGLLHLSGDLGLQLEPASGSWWRARPLWLAGLSLALFPLVLVLSRFERPKSGGPAPGAWRLVLGAAAVCAGLALLALHGVGGTGRFDFLGLNPLYLSLPFAGALLIGLSSRGSAGLQPGPGPKGPQPGSGAK
jgi:hypothetical protein